VKTEHQPDEDSYFGLPGVKEAGIKPNSPGHLKPVLVMLDKSTVDYIPEGTPMVEPGELSRLGLNVPRIIFSLGKRRAIFLKIPRFAARIARTVINRSIGYTSLRRNPVHPKTTADESVIQEIRDMASGLGCGEVGFTSVPRDFVFSNKSILYPNAIVLTMEMNKDRVSRAPSMSTGREVCRTYDQLGVVVNKIATQLRRRGFAVQAGAALGGDVNYPRLAQKAGLGWIGKHGLLISPGRGPSQRIAAIYTSIENLPNTDSNSYEWIGDFCNNCHVCVQACPGEAIFDTKPIMNDGNPKHIDYIRCAGPFAESVGCSVCIKSCIFFRGDFEKIRQLHKKKSE